MKQQSILLKGETVLCTPDKLHVNSVPLQYQRPSQAQSAGGKVIFRHNKNTV
uniref:Uncharacterized protein n=1 Tax=Anguilla anguilla TaxID=7936 RepID=A0A0E9RB47_ANGAN